MTMLPCPRRAEHMGYMSKGAVDEWRDRSGYPVCSWCGSLHPDALFKAIEDGCECGPTDKNYKLYVHLPNPNVGKIEICGSDSGPAFDAQGKPTRDDLTAEERVDGRYRRDISAHAPPTLQMKFYFQHLSDDERKKFVELLNAKKVKLGYPGRFYAMPYFMSVQIASTGHITGAPNA